MYSCFKYFFTKRGKLREFVILGEILLLIIKCWRVSWQWHLWRWKRAKVFLWTTQRHSIYVQYHSCYRWSWSSKYLRVLLHEWLHFCCPCDIFLALFIFCPTLVKWRTLIGYTMVILSQPNIWSQVNGYSLYITKKPELSMVKS